VGDPNLFEPAAVVADSLNVPVEVVRPFPARSRALRKLVRWVTKGGLAVVEQGVVSGSNFVMGILLARWMMPDQYGAYALAFAVFLLLSLLYQALLLEPMAVFGGSAYRNCLQGYLRSLLWIHVAITVVVVIVLAMSAGVVSALGRSVGLPGALVGMTIAAPCVLLSWLARRSFYLKLMPAFAAIGALLYAALVLGGLFWAHKRGEVSPFAAFVLMGLGALMSSALLFWRLKSEFRDSNAIPPSLRVAWRRHWEYGRWALAAACVAWLPAYIYYPLLSTFYGMARAGEFRALMNLVMPLMQGFGALAILFLPYASRIHGDEGRAGVAPVTRRITLIFVGGAVVYWGLIAPLRGPVFHFLYGGKYMGIAHLIPLVALGSLLWSATLGPVIVLRAIESPASVFVAHTAASIIALTVGIPITWFFGLWGAVIGLIASSAVSFLMALYLLRRKMRETPN
jgi:O-antigen/teichoic acid export membrane protein